MIKKYWEITLRDYDIIEKTGNIGHLKRWYNFLPVFLFKKGISKELSVIREKLNGADKSDMDKDAFLWRTQSLLKIEAIRVNLMGAMNILDLGTKLTAISSIHARRVRRKLKMKTGNLSIYIKNLTFYTGIKIESIEDLKAVFDELEYRIDKYKDLEKRQAAKTDDRVYLMAYALGVFSFLNQTLNVHLTILEFIDARDRAIEESKKQKQWQK